MQDSHATKKLLIRRDSRAWLPTTLQRLSPAQFIRTANRVLRGEDVIVRLPGTPDEALIVGRTAGAAPVRSSARTAQERSIRH